MSFHAKRLLQAVNCLMTPISQRTSMAQTTQKGIPDIHKSSGTAYPAYKVSDSLDVSDSVEVGNPHIAPHLLYAVQNSWHLGACSHLLFVWELTLFKKMSPQLKMFACISLAHTSCNHTHSFWSCFLLAGLEVEDCMLCMTKGADWFPS